ncbi:hypothetical protein EDB19DRAFT_1957732 [Suillus lakei]|nr:hypothetical protein EDB19DRAFT_1957732 [Suillus lakei]
MGTVDNTFGAFLIGVIVSAALYGVTCVQTWYYFSRYFSDPWYNRLLVGAIFVSDSIHQALITHTVYTYLVTDFDSASDLEKLVWSLSVEVLFNGFTGFMVQSFLTMRVYKLSNKNIIATASVLSLVIAEFVLVVIYVAKAVKLTTFIQVPELKPLSMSVNAVAAAGDILIAAFLCIFLQRSRTGFRKSDTLIHKLMLFSINTGLLTSICAVMSLISCGRIPSFTSHSISAWAVQPSTHARVSAAILVTNICRSRYRELGPINSPIGSSRIGMPNDLSIKIDTTQEYIEDEGS